MGGCARLWTVGGTEHRSFMRVVKAGESTLATNLFAWPLQHASSLLLLGSAVTTPLNCSHKPSAIIVRVQCSEVAERLGSLFGEARAAGCLDMAASDEEPERVLNTVNFAHHQKGYDPSKGLK